jgi:hypothetical protein
MSPVLKATLATAGVFALGAALILAPRPVLQIVWFCALFGCIWAGFYRIFK